MNGKPPPADQIRHELHAVEAANNVAAEAKQLREQLDRITGASELLETLKREGLPLIVRLRALAADLQAEHDRAVNGITITRAQLQNAADTLREAMTLLEQVARINELGPKVERIERLIGMLDQAELIAWYH